MKRKEINDMTKNLQEILKDIPNIEILKELKRRLDNNIKDNKPTREELEQIPRNKNNSELVGRMTNNPARHEYNLMGKVLGLYENQPKNLLSFEQKEVMGSQVLFTFLEVFKEYEPVKEKLKTGTVIKIYGRLNNTINQKTGGRSFSVYSFTDFPEKVINFNNSSRGQPP